MYIMPYDYFIGMKVFATDASLAYLSGAPGIRYVKK